MTWEWYDTIRCVTASISILAMYYLGLSWLKRNKEYSDRLKDFWWALNVMLFCFAAGSLEQVIRNREETWTLFISLFAAAIALKAARNKDRTLLKGDGNS